MSDLNDEDLTQDELDVTELSGVGGARKKRRGLPGCLAVLVALGLIVGGVYFVASSGLDYLKDKFQSAEDFSGPGHGKVIFEVSSGDTIADMGRGLKQQKVVASVEAFTSAASANTESTGIQAGFYQLQKEMKASDVVLILVDPGNLVKNTVTIPEGLRVVEIVHILADKTDLKRAAFEKVLENPAQLGLPDYAAGNPEGYLFPATYDFGPNETPKTILQSMVARWEQSAEASDLEGAAAALGYTPAELMIVASLIESEASREEDRGKVARVIYNRLENPNNGETNGLLQIDATVNYALDRDLGVGLTREDLKIDSPYNTYRHAGLPPTPIEAPGDAAIAAASNPTEGPWLYYVTVNLRTGETKFTANYAEFLAFKDELGVYCETSEAC